ncbi:MAG: 16S rRNA (cytidine(1402)-2'-O)-methyltransferase [Myxococcota bacterium]
MGTLYVVATPIGNLEDVTLRALRVLREAALVLAEDTRRTRILLDHHGIAARPVSLHAHNEAARVERALEALRAGDAIALVSDAGTPLVSDPGERLVRAAIDDGHDVVPVPGASAPLAALVASGLRAQPFAFVGFPPRRRAARRALLAPFAARGETLVLFESPRRVGATLRELAEWLGAERRACVARELTKLHEELARGSLGELAERYASGARGEVTIAVEGRDADAAPEVDDDAVEREIAARVRAGERPREIAAAMAPATGLAKRALYARAVAASGRAAEDGRGGAPARARGTDG